MNADAPRHAASLPPDNLPHNAPREAPGVSVSGRERFVAALQFLTILPLRTPGSSEALGRSIAYFPAAGLVIGAILALAHRLILAPFFPSAVAAALDVTLWAILTGGLHLDGLADTADGFFSARSRERALEIMRDSRIGTMGALALIAVLGLKVLALCSLPPEALTRALLFAPLAGRCLMADALARQPYARAEGGRASIFMAYRSDDQGLFALVLLLVGALSATIGTFRSLSGLAIAAACLFAAWLFKRLCLRRIGGITGDTLGALCELVEAVALLATCALMKGPALS